MVLLRIRRRLSRPTSLRGNILFCLRQPAFASLPPWSRSLAEQNGAMLKRFVFAREDRPGALVGDDDLAHRMLSHYRPPPVVGGCSQAVWLGDDGPTLVRNYDFALDVVT